MTKRKRCRVCNAARAMDSYMVTPDVWAMCGMRQGDIAHFDCLDEVHIATCGRRITADDLTDAPINNVARRIASKRVAR